MISRRRQFGNMLLSRWPLMSVRNHMLPKHRLLAPMSLQRAALEAVIALPDGPCRVISTHLAHASASERLAQIDHLLAVLETADDDGSPWSGRDHDAHWAAHGMPPPPPRRSVVMGDFNMVPRSPEYDRLCGATDPRYGPLSTVGGLNDAWVAAGAPEDGTAATVPDGRRIDYVLVSGNLAGPFAPSGSTVRRGGPTTGRCTWSWPSGEGATGVRGEAEATWRASRRRAATIGSLRIMYIMDN